MTVPFDRQIWSGQDCADYLGIGTTAFLNYTQFIESFPKRCTPAGIHPRWRAKAVCDWFNSRRRLTCLYRHYDDAGRLLYVGIALSPVSRLRAHRARAHWFDDIARITIERFGDTAAARKAERTAVEVEKPLFNIKLVRNA
jgi:hypothetical protein